MHNTQNIKSKNFEKKNNIFSEKRCIFLSTKTNKKFYNFVKKVKNLRNLDMDKCHFLSSGRRRRDLKIFSSFRRPNSRALRTRSGPSALRSVARPPSAASLRSE